MDIDEDDDLYQPEEPKLEFDEDRKRPTKYEELEEGEEEEEGGAMEDDEDEDDSDIDIITERKDGTKAAPPPQSKYSDIRNIPQRTATNDTPAGKSSSVVKKEDESRTINASNIAAPSADSASAAESKCTIDINAIPIHPGSGKPLTQVNIDEDLPGNDKPWRKPGTDISDYFNFGFDEFTWALYAAKQESIRGEFGADVFAANNKKMMEDFNMMMMGGGMNMGGGGGGGGGNGPGGGGMPGMDGMPPEMQAMMQQMMASGMDPSQMDPGQMAAMFSGMQGGGVPGGGPGGGGVGGNGVPGGQVQGFGGGFGGGGQGFGYDQGMAGGGGGGGGRGGFGGGRGRRGRW